MSEVVASVLGVEQAFGELRYFPNQRALLVASFSLIERRSLLPEDAPADPEARLEAVIEELTRMTVDAEPQLRAMLRLSLESDSSHRDDLLLRRGRAIGWIEEALAPIRKQVPEPDLHRLALAVRSAAGIEALIWLTDVAGLPREEAVDLMRWSALSLLRSALADGPPRS